MVGGVHAVGRTEGAEHLGRELEVDYVDHLVAVQPELSAGYPHGDGVPLLIVRMPQHRRLHPVVKGIVGGGSVDGEAVGEKLLFGHNSPY